MSSAFCAGRRTDDPEQLDELAAELLAAVEQPFVVDELSLEVGASIGVARFPVDGDRRAHAAAPGRHRDVRRQGNQSGCKLYYGRAGSPFDAER